MTTEPQETLENEPGAGPELAPPASVRSLVEQMVAAGEWPEPTLLEQIVAAGQSAVEPLREVLKSRPRGWPEEASICHAAGLLSVIQPASALPDLCVLARFYKNDTTTSMGNALAAYGRPGLDALIELIRDPSVSGYQRESLIESGLRAAGSDPELRARLAEAVREVFARVVDEARQAEAFQDELLAEPLSEDTSLEELDEEEFKQLERKSKSDSEDLEDLIDSGDDDELDGELDEEGIRHLEDSNNEIAPDEALEHLAMDLAVLADSQGRELVVSAAEEGLIHDGELFPEVVGDVFEAGGEIYESAPPWLEDYKQSLVEQRESDARLARMPQVEFPSVASYPSFERMPGASEPPPVQPVEPFRNAAARIGRNDPCWCGSGKKYKKCHLGKDTPK